MASSKSTTPAALVVCAIAVVLAVVVAVSFDSPTSVFLLVAIVFVALALGGGLTLRGRR
ncbi:hypothetical protein ABFT23_08500 [Nocardioides sp. C4-1]|uniref:hypothetical protein n=1 Tax=Nocardioides sp. C4-1 TaxID=3151851 RepID=UPI0032666E53